MPRIMRVYITQSILGFGLAAVFTALLLWFDVANLWYLVTHTETGPFAVFLFWVLNGIVFAGVQFGIALTWMQTDGGSSGRGGGRRRAPVPVEASEPVRRSL